MGWLKLDDGFCDNPKVIGLSARAFRTYVQGLCYCAKHLTDGRIPAKVQRNSSQTAKELVAARLWAIDDDGTIVVHDYLEWNPSKASVQAKREEDAARKQRENPRGIQTESERNLFGIRASRKTRKRETSNEVSRPRPPDPIWDALEAIFGRVTPGTTAHGKRNKAVSDLRKQGATSESVASAYRKWGRLFDHATPTDMALAKHYPQLVTGTIHAPKAASKGDVVAFPDLNVKGF